MEHERHRVRPIPNRFTEPVIAGGFQHAFDEISASENPEAAREAFMSQTRQIAAKFFLGHEELVDPILEQMDEMLRNHDGRFAQEMAGKLSEVFAQMYRDPETAERFHKHLRDEERVEREQKVEAVNGVSLSPESMLYGLLDMGDDTTFRIHIALAHTLELRELLADFHQGMRELARLVQSDPAYKHVEKIIGTSWIVGEHPDVARRMGFHVDTEPLSPEDMLHFVGEKRQVRKSWMTRDELIERYGRPNAS